MKANPDPRELIAEQLDTLLYQKLDAEEVLRVARRSYEDARQSVERIDLQARRLRLAIFDLDDEHTAVDPRYRPGKANEANLERLTLLRAQR